MKIYLSCNMNELIRSIHKHKTWRNKERSGLCKVDKQPGTNDYYITDVFFPKQKNAVSATEFTGEPLDELASYLMGKDPINGINDYGKYAVWLHSHHSMNAFRSGTDYNTRKGFKDWGCEEFVSLVTSHKSGDNDCYGVFYNCTLDVFKPCEFDIDLEVNVGIPGMTRFEEKEHESYTAYKTEQQEKNDLITNNKELLKSRYGLSDEQIDEKLKLLTDDMYKGTRTRTVYYEDQSLALDIEDKITELEDVEEVAYVYQGYKGGYGGYTDYDFGGYNKKKREQLSDYWNKNKKDDLRDLE